MAEGQVVNLIQLFEQAALEVTGRKLTGLTQSTVISQLGMDSVAVMELVSFFEEKLSVRLPDEDLARISTIQDLGKLIERLMPAGTKVAAA